MLIRSISLKDSKLRKTGTLILPGGPLHKAAVLNPFHKLIHAVRRPGVCHETREKIIGIRPLAESARDIRNTEKDALAGTETSNLAIPDGYISTWADFINYRTGARFSRFFPGRVFPRTDNGRGFLPFRFRFRRRPGFRFFRRFRVREAIPQIAEVDKFGTGFDGKSKSSHFFDSRKKGLYTPESHNFINRPAPPVTVYPKHKAQMIILTLPLVRLIIAVGLVEPTPIIIPQFRRKSKRKSKNFLKIFPM